jgi:hypothetical protein
MNRDDIIKMAREAGAMFDHMTWVERDLAPVFERFAALVAAHEREACAKVCEERQEVFQKYYTKGLAAMCAEAIRARGDSETNR